MGIDFGEGMDSIMNFGSTEGSMIDLSGGADGQAFDLGSIFGDLFGTGKDKESDSENESEIEPIEAEAEVDDQQEQQFGFGW